MKKRNHQPMPAVWHDERREKEAREKVVNLLYAVQQNIAKIRENGVTIANEKELKALTPESVKKQIAEVKQRRLGERFLPSSIRNQEAAAFARLEAVMTREAEDLQETLKSIPFPIVVAEKADETYFDSDAVEEYIEQAANVEIPQIVRDYYDELTKVCDAWADFAEWCAANGIKAPTHRVLQMLAPCPSGLADDTATLTITPEKMYNFAGWILPISK